MNALRTSFDRQRQEGPLVILSRRLMSDQLTPVLAYRRLVLPDERTAPSFLFESVENGATIGRHSILAARPALELSARGFDTTIVDHRRQTRRTERAADPLAVLRGLAAEHRPASAEALAPLGLPRAFTGGFVGFASFDSVRYLEPEKLSFEKAPRDDRGVPDLHFGLYRDVVVFDHVSKTMHAIVSARTDEFPSADRAFAALVDRLDALEAQLAANGPQLPHGSIDIDLARRPETPSSNLTRDEFERMVLRAKEYIAAGDAFQVVLSQRLERRTAVDPFDLYRALRVVNPSPYQIYLQGEGVILVASSPEILCRVHGGVVTNRPLAGTRPRGKTPDEDRALEEELLADAKERAEHVMLVDLGRNDLGRVCEPGSVSIDRCMEVERYSHVMHISSTVTGRLRAGLDAFDALRATLPVGTVSGAPKVRAIEIIDELEPTRRGPYSGGIGAIGYSGDMDIALALRTMVVPVQGAGSAPWTVHLQAGAGVVLDSDPAAEWQETVNKASALGRAIDLAESAFKQAE
ncbi:MAG: anthranilate synthase component I [Planctomycetaceae bacterium]|nr:anthranilate synthase component I [Planctomycetaceae bacterium]